MTRQVFRIKQIDTRRIDANEPNASFVTGWAEIRNGATSTVRTGPSPSPGNPAGSSVPMRNVPPGMSSRSALTGPSPASTSRSWALPDRGVGASGVQQGPPIVQIIVGTRPLVTVDRGRQPLWTMGWHDRGREERSCRRSSASGRAFPSQTHLRRRPAVRSAGSTRGVPADPAAAPTGGCSERPHRAGR